MIYTRPIQTGQPTLDGRSCYGCEDDAALFVEFRREKQAQEVRLCWPCVTELRDALELSRLRWPK